MSPAVAEKLAASGIQLLAETQSYFLFGREAFIALVERTASGFGSIGSTGVMTERGLAYLVWREGQALLVSKGSEQPAAGEMLAAIERFSAELAGALAGS